jgi:hypothetical protein
MRKLNFWDVPISGADRQRVQDEYTDFVGGRMRELAGVSKDTDAERRHAGRLVLVQQAIRSAIAGSDVLSDDAPVVEMAAAAVAVYERAHGR